MLGYLGLLAQPAKGERGTAGAPGAAGADGKDADNVNECMTNNGGCQDVCINTLGGFYCACGKGSRLSPVTPPRCDAGTEYCEQYYFYGRLCYCKVNGVVTPVQGTRCQDADECAVDNGGCEHICEPTQGGHVCKCELGYKLQNNGQGCEDVNECERTDNGCRGACVNTPGGYYCICNEFRQKEPSQVKIWDSSIPASRCEGFPLSHTLQYNCENPNVNFGLQSCSCPVRGTTRRTLVEKTGGCLRQNIKCQWVDDVTYVCVCHVTTPTDQLQTITLNGTDCPLKDECLTNNGGCAHKCTNLDNGFKCSCNRGPGGYRPAVYTLSSNDYDCIDINECASQSFVDLNCPPPSKCINTPGFFTCIQNTAISKSGIVSSAAAGAGVSVSTVTGFAWAAVATIVVVILAAVVVVNKKINAARTAATQRDIESSLSS